MKGVLLSRCSEMNLSKSGLFLQQDMKSGYAGWSIRYNAGYLNSVPDVTRVLAIAPRGVLDPCLGI